MQALRHYIKNHIILAGIVAILVLFAGGSLLHNATQASGTANASESGAAPAPAVDVMIAQPRQVRIWSNFSGRLVAVDDVDIRPLVGGAITEILFDEGAVVEKGAPLFVIDPRPFEAEVNSAKAELASAESQRALALAELNRAKQLVDDGFISKSALDTRSNAFKVSLAAINAAKARLQQAQLDLEYAHITAPVSGRISRAEITVGNVIQAGPNAPILTSIVSNDRLFAEFDIDEQTYVKTVRRSKGSDMPVEMTLPEDTTIYKGTIQSFDNQLDTTSGTIRARAIFDNTDGVLMPGMYADIRLGAASENPTMMISDRAVGTDQNKKFVYVVDESNTITYREVQLGRSIDGQREVLSGLSAGEKILVNSLQQVRPGMAVQPVTTAPDEETHAAGVAEQLKNKQVKN